MIRRIDGYFLSAGHAHRGFAEHAHHFLEGVLAGQGVAALQHADFFPGVGQKDVDGRRLALAPLLNVELYAGLLVHILPDNLLGAVGAARGDDNDLGDLDLVQPLVDDRLQETADIRFTLRPENEGTVVTVSPLYKLKFGVLGELLDRVYVRKSYQKGMESLLAGLKAHVENEAVGN